MIKRPTPSQMERRLDWMIRLWIGLLIAVALYDIFSWRPWRVLE